jgi:hypothetical protein
MLIFCSGKGKEEESDIYGVSPEQEEEKTDAEYQNV